MVKRDEAKSKKLKLFMIGFIVWAVITFVVQTNSGATLGKRISSVLGIGFIAILWFVVQKFWLKNV